MQFFNDIILFFSNYVAFITIFHTILHFTPQIEEMIILPLFLKYVYYPYAIDPNDSCTSLPRRFTDHVGL